MNDAMYHLGKLVYLLRDLNGNHKCQAIIDAEKYWNENNPEGLTIQSSGFGYSILLHRHPIIDQDIYNEEEGT